MTQRRWLCEDCGREWLYARNWDESSGCPACHSARVRLVEYRAEFHGADIPRNGAIDPQPETVVPTAATRTPLVLAGGYL